MTGHWLGPGVCGSGWAAVEQQAAAAELAGAPASQAELCKVQDLLLLFSERLQKLEEGLAGCGPPTADTDTVAHSPGASFLH